ncbi:MAG: protoporphyrinogen oxidase [Opitutaceae bacterium]
MAARRIAVLGGGITGLAAAYHLSRRGCAVRLFEGSDRCGGMLRTHMEEGWLAEDGPNSIQETPEVCGLIRELNLAEEREAASPSAKRRYLVARRRLVPLPLTPQALFGSRLFSPWAKLRILAELRRRPGLLPDDMSFTAFVTDHFGAEALRIVAQPFVAGFCAGDPDRLSAPAAFPRLWAMARESGSLLRAQLRSARERRRHGLPGLPGIISFRGGIERLPEALEAALPSGTLSTRRAVERLSEADGLWTAEGRDGEGSRWRESFTDIISALPAQALAGLAVGPVGDRPFSFLGGLERPPVASLFAGFEARSIHHPLDGFGFLAPVSERLPFLGAIFSSALFPGRAPENHAAVTVMFGGALQPGQAQPDAGALWRAARDPLRRLLRIDGEPVFLRAACWPEAIPQYNLGHAAILARLADAERAFPGLAVLGSFRTGISVPDCLAAARRTAEAVTGAR